MIKTVVLDLDGTLYRAANMTEYTHNYFSQALSKTSFEIEIKWDESYKEVLASGEKFEDPREFYRKVDRGMMQRLEIPEEKIAETIRTVDEVIIPKLIFEIKPFEYLTEFLDWCKIKGLGRYVLSGGRSTKMRMRTTYNHEDHQKTKHEQIKKLGLTDYFHEIISSTKYNGFKPDLEVFQGFLKDKKLKAEECVYIGDSWVDMEAKKVGMHTILINPDNNSYPKDKTPPEFIAQNYNEILKIVEKLVY